MEKQSNYAAFLVSNMTEDLERHMKKSIFCYVDIETDGGLISIENRQHYCDRGRFLVKVFPTDVKKLYVDEADMFPRYYFVWDNLWLELAHWIKARKLTVLSINKKEASDDE